MIRVVKLTLLSYKLPTRVKVILLSLSRLCTVWAKTEMTPYLFKLSLISKTYELSQKLALEADGVEDHVFSFFLIYLSSSRISFLCLNSQ